MLCFMEKLLKAARVIFVQRLNRLDVQVKSTSFSYHFCDCSRRTLQSGHLEMVQ